MVQPTPYTPGSIARHLSGREAQLAEIDERLDYMLTYRTAIPRIRIDQAPRGYGKTSLLAEITRRARAQNVLTIRLVGGETTLMGALTRALDRAATNWSAERTGGLRGALRRLDVKLDVGIPGLAHLESTLNHPEAEDKAPEAAITSEDFQDLITTSVDAASSAGHRGLLLIVDELQDADPPGLRALCYGWQRIQEQPDGLPAGIIAAGLPSTRAVLREAVSNSERLELRQLGTLSPQASADALVEPAAVRGVSWDYAAVQAAVDYTGGFPYTLQLIGDRAWVAAGRPDPGQHITVQHVDAARGGIRADLHSQHEARWARATPAQRRILRVMAELGGDQPITRADLVDRLGTSSRSLSRIRDELIVAGAIEPSSHGELRFTASGFAQYVLDRSTPGDVEAERAVELADLGGPAQGTGPLSTPSTSTDDPFQATHTPEPQHNQPRPR